MLYYLSYCSMSCVQCLSFGFFGLLLCLPLCLFVSVFVCVALGCVGLSACICSVRFRFLNYARVRSV